MQVPHKIIVLKHQPGIPENNKKLKRLDIEAPSIQEQLFDVSKEPIEAGYDTPVLDVYVLNQDGLILSECKTLSGGNLTVVPLHVRMYVHICADHSTGVLNEFKKPKPLHGDDVSCNIVCMYTCMYVLFYVRIYVCVCMISLYSFVCI
jgi:hypothetical protein